MDMALKRTDNVLIVVHDLEAAMVFAACNTNRWIAAGALIE
jgi:predicted small secreted protein